MTESTNGLQSLKMELEPPLVRMAWMTIPLQAIKNNENATDDAIGRIYSREILHEQDFYPTTFYGETVQVFNLINERMNLDLTSNLNCPLPPPSFCIFYPYSLIPP
jgi:hypothetical protein